MTAAGQEAPLIEQLSLHGRCDVFRDREAAGCVLAELVRGAELSADLVLAVPAGGVPVATALAEKLRLPLDVAVVSKITLPWNTESGYGAVAFDGSVILNDELVRICNLTTADVERGIANTTCKVERRTVSLRRGRGPLALAGKAVILVDDGLASGFTMLAAIAALRRAGVARLVVAVPTAHTRALERIRCEADCVVCANVRGGPSFAVADAYQSWQDVPEAMAEIALERAHVLRP